MHKTSKKKSKYRSPAPWKYENNLCIDNFKNQVSAVSTEYTIEELFLPGPSPGTAILGYSGVQHLRT
jgi:hypothetical protein